MHLLNCGLFLGFALAAALADLRFRRIPNWLNMAGAGLGMLVSGLGPSGNWGQSGLGLAVALAIGLVLYLIKALGAGDAKLMAAFGAWFGLARLPAAFVAMMAGGALLAVLWALRRRVLRKTLVSTGAMLASAISGADLMRPQVGDTPSGKFPYGIGLSAGAAVWWLWTGCGIP